MIDVKESIARRAHVGSLEEYEKLYRESLDQPEEFWRRQMERLDWIEPPTGIHEFDRPIFGLSVVSDDLSALEVHSEVAVQRAVIHHVLLDDLTAISKRNHEVLEAVMRVMHHDMPHNRHTTDLHHGLGLDLGLFNKTSAHSSCQNSYLHVLLLWGFCYWACLRRISLGRFGGAKPVGIPVRWGAAVAKPPIGPVAVCYKLL